MKQRLFLIFYYWFRSIQFAHPFVPATSLATSCPLRTCSRTSDGSSLSITTSSIRRSATRLYNWRSTVSRQRNAADAIQELLKESSDIQKEINDNGQQAVAFLFVSEFHTYRFPQIVQQAYARLGNDNVLLLSVVGGGVIGGNEEFDESMPVMSLLWGTLPPGAKATGFYDGPKQSKTAVFSSLLAGDSSERYNSRIIFADPWFDIEDTILSDSSHHKDNIIVGGISCPSVFADEIRPTVAINGTALPQGSAAGVSFSGPFGIQAIVAQGCRPIGPIFTITSAEGNVLKELDGVPALTQLERVASEASIRDKQLMERNGLLCGIAEMNSGSSSNNNNNNDTSAEALTSAATPATATTASVPKDFLIRQIMGLLNLGVDKTGTGGGGGALALGLKTLRVGDAFQFQVRDGTVAKEDMNTMMKRAKVERLFEGQSAGTPVAALQISCVARGRSLFGSPNVDLKLIQEQLLGGELPTTDGKDNQTNNKSSCTVPVGGFFANGEIGPIGISGFGSSLDSATHIHTFTTIVGLFCDYSNARQGKAISTDQSIDLFSEEDWG